MNDRSPKNWIDLNKPIIPQLEKKVNKCETDFYYDHWVYFVKTKKQISMFADNDKDHATMGYLMIVPMIFLGLIMAHCFDCMEDIVVEHILKAWLSGTVKMFFFHSVVLLFSLALYILGFVLHLIIEYFVHVLFHTRIFPITFHFIMHGIHHVAPFNIDYILSDVLFVGFIDLVISFIWIAIWDMFLRITILLFPRLEYMSDALYSFPFIILAGMLSSLFFSRFMMYYSHAIGTNHMKKPLIQTFDILTKGFKEEKESYTRLYKHHQYGVISQFVPINLMALFAKLNANKME